MLIMIAPHDAESTPLSGHPRRERLSLARHRTVPLVPITAVEEAAAAVTAFIAHIEEA
jgi:hypothetical protein